MAVAARDQYGKILEKGDHFRYAYREGVIVEGVVTEVTGGVIAGAGQQQPGPMMVQALLQVVFNVAPTGHIIGLMKVDPPAEKKSLVTEG